MSNFDSPGEEPIINHEIERDFSYHSPKPGQPEKYQKIRDKAKELAYLILDLVPNGPDMPDNWQLGKEKNMAIMRLQEVVMWANAGIARLELGANQGWLFTKDGAKIIDTPENYNPDEGESLIPPQPLFDPLAVITDPEKLLRAAQEDDDRRTALHKTLN